MRKLVLLLAVFAGTGCSVQRATLRPSQVNDSLHDLDADAQNPFARDPNRLQYVQTGAADYDGFFKEAAQVNGTVVLTNVMLAETNDYLTKSKGDLAGSGKVDAATAATSRATQGQPALTPDRKAALTQRADRLEVLGQMLGAVPGRSADLAVTGRKLAVDAKGRFSGLGMLKLPLITQGVDDALNQLQRAGNQAPSLATQVEQTHHTLLAMLDDKAPAPGISSGTAVDPNTSAVGKARRKKAATAVKKKKPTRG